MAASSIPAAGPAGPAARARLFHALSDETRLAVLDLLRAGERCVCDLQDDLDAIAAMINRFDQGCEIVYGVRRDRSSDDSMWFGAKSMFDKAGFEEVARRRPERPIVRLRAK